MRVLLQRFGLVRFGFGALLLCCVSLASGYQPDFEASIPESLLPWKAWVLQDLPNQACPFKASRFKQRHCNWPALLKLQADQSGLGFELLLYRYQPGWSTLPGGEGFWPLQIKVNAQDQAAVTYKKRPALYLSAGKHRITGRINWQKIPSSLLIPRQTGLLDLRVNEEFVQLPRRDQQGRLWLLEKQASKPSQAAMENRLVVSVFRLLQDTLPFQLTTEIHLEVAGQPREVLLGLALLPGFRLQALQSPLPARVEANGQLRLQLRPGTWRIRVEALQANPVAGIELPKTSVSEHWPETELWSWQPQPALRRVTLSGADTVDPQQTDMPQEWKSWPAFRVQPGQSLNLETVRRGDPEPAPNRLRIDREAWISFSGKGLIFRDHLQGELSRDWRLNMSTPFRLGYAMVNEEPQVVTLIDKLPGVEVRSRKLDLQAVSQLTDFDDRVLQIPAVGWQLDADRLSLQLNLPPGWRLLAATDVDQVSNAWLNQWQVWDIFLLLITVAALIKLRGWLVGLLSGVAFMLIYPEAPLILWLWLNLIAALALLRLVAAGKLQAVLVVYARLAALVALLVVLPFLVDQARIAIYPQLEMGYYNTAMSYGGTQPHVYEEMDSGSSVAIVESASNYVASKAKTQVLSKRAMAPEPQQQLIQIDPKAAAQTGPSVPMWHWQSAHLDWSGPVAKDEVIQLYFLKPLDSRVLALLRVLLLVLAALGLLRGWQNSALRFKGRGQTLGVLVAVMLLGFASLPPSSWAQGQPALGSPASLTENAVQPSPRLLEQLKQRLQKASDCTPDCFAINQAQLRLQDSRLTLIMQVQALERIQFPLPKAGQSWQLDEVLVDAEIAPLRTTQSQWLWLALDKGLHRVSMSGHISLMQPLELRFTDANMHNLKVIAEGWQIQGVDNGRVSGGAITLIPPQQHKIISEQQDSQLASNLIAPFVRVERQLQLGLNWYVETRVTRIAPQQGAIKLSIPLIAGESVTSEQAQVVSQQVKVVLSPEQRQFAWRSSLEKTATISLQAGAEVPWVETWALLAAPIWNVQPEGLAPIKPSPNTRRWQPQWFPFPGERLTLAISRPLTAPGVTSSIDYAKLIIKPGKGVVDYDLSLRIRSSKGTEQLINLAEQARVLALKIDGQAQPSREENIRLLVPINPGEHELNLQWREPRETGQVLYESPNIDVAGLVSNIETEVQLPRSQWLLFVGGPQVGPAVLIWGELLVVLLLAVALARIPGLPLNTWQWMLLGIGLCVGRLETGIIVVGWFVAMQQKRQHAGKLNDGVFNLVQVALLLLTLFALLTLLAIIPMGLMASPNMGVVGNGSGQFALRWYQDYAESGLSDIWWVALPMWAYRVLMLLWSLWLAVAILRWLPWAWDCFSAGGMWRKSAVKSAKKTAALASAAETDADKNNQAESSEKNA